MNSGQIKEPLRIMLVEDSEYECLAFSRAFQKNGTPCEITHFQKAELALERLRADASGFDILVSDYKLPGISGLDFFREYRALGIAQPFVIMTGFGSEQLAVEVLKAGVVDYLVKDSGQYYLDLLPVQLLETVSKYKDRLARQQIEEAFRNTERRLADVIDFLPDATFAIDLEGRIIIWNRTAEEVTGVKAQEMLGKGDCEYAIPFYGMRRQLLIDLVFKPSSEIEKLYPFVKRDGDRIQGEAYINHARRGKAYVLGVAAPLYDSDGRVIGAIESVRDISERKIDEEALHESERKLKSVVDGSPIPQFVIDRNHKILYWNWALEELSGVKSEDVVGKTLPRKLIGLDERPSMADLLLDGRIEEVEGLCRSTCSKSKLAPDAYEATGFFPALDKEGKWLYFTSVVLKDSKGQIVGAMETIEDITGRRQMEEELLKAQKLEAVALLAGGIAHDFNNLLTSILGNISLAKLLAPPGEKIGQFLAAAEQASLRAKTLTKRLITFARGGAPVRKVISLAPLVRDSSELALSGSKSLCQYLLPKDLWPVEADEGQLSQVINNVVVNADQSMPGGGRIAIRCCNVVVTDQDALPLKNGRYVRIDIEDQGSGIPEESLGKVFDPYYTTRESGKGLGLTLAYSIIKKHDGHIAVKSHPGAGSVFSIHIPASEGLPAAIQEVQDQVQDLHGQVQEAAHGRILIMDDEEIVRIVLGEMLKHLGYEVVSSTNGREAVDLYAGAMQSGCPFDAVIMDLTIPGGMGGKEAVRLLRELHPPARVIVSSGYSNDPVMSDFREYGFSGVVLKPYQVTELAGTLEDVLAGKLA